MIYDPCDSPFEVSLLEIVSLFTFFWSKQAALQSSIDQAEKFQTPVLLWVFLLAEIFEPTSAYLWNGEKLHYMDEKFGWKTVNKCGNLVFVSSYSIRKILSPHLTAHRFAYIKTYIKIYSLALSNSLI